MNRFAAISISALVSASSAQAAGFYFGDNGSKCLIQGGACAAQADDLNAIQHNPAGMAQQDGWSALVDAELLNHEVTFLRQDPGFDPAAPSNLVKPVSNKGGLFFLPFAAVSKGFTLADRKFNVALGIYTPPSVGRYEFATPNYDKDENNKYIESPVKFAPQRYSLIKNNVIVAYPTLTLSGEVIPQKVSVGLSVQAVYSAFNFTQAIYSGLFTPAKQSAEQPEFDSLVNVDVQGKWGVTGILGVLVKPTDTLSFGASFRPSIPVQASGTLTLNLGEVPKQLTTVAGNRTNFAMTLPAELRVGARFMPIDRLGINADFVYQGWDSVDQIVLTPTDITTQIGNGEPTSVAPLKVVKKWKGSFSGRLGGSFDIIKQLTVHAGVFYETSSSADEYYTLDFAHPNRVFITGGASVHLGYFDLVGGIAYAPTVTTNVVQSEVHQGQTDPAVMGNVVGAGVYSSGGFTATFGVRFTTGTFRKNPFDTNDVKQEPKPTDAPAAAPVAAPAEKPAAPAAPEAAPKETP